MPHADFSLLLKLKVGDQTPKEGVLRERGRPRGPPIVLVCSCLWASTVAEMGMIGREAERGEAEGRGG